MASHDMPAAQPAPGGHDQALARDGSHSHGHGHAHGHAHDHAHDDFQEADHFNLPTYVTGFVLAAILTAIPFWIVMARPIASTVVAGGLVIALAIVQIIVHTVAFLHVNARAQGGWSLVAYVFTAVLVIITIAGSLWIMYHLNTNMMPGMMRETLNAEAAGAAAGH